MSTVKVDVRFTLQPSEIAPSGPPVALGNINAVAGHALPNMRVYVLRDQVIRALQTFGVKDVDTGGGFGRYDMSFEILLVHVEAAKAKVDAILARESTWKWDQRSAS